MGKTQKIPRVWESAFVNSLPVLMGYSTMGAAFGLLMVKQNFPLWTVLLMSVTIISGSLQFAAVGMLAVGMSLAETALMSLLINIRYSMYGLSLIEPFRQCGWKRWYMIFTLTDETYALQVQDDRPEGTDRRTFMLLIGLFDHLYWIAGGLIGALAGKYLAFNTQGIEFAMTALFLVIAVEQWKVRTNRLPAMIGACTTLAALMLFGPKQMLLPAMLFIIGVLLLRRYRRRRQERQTETTIS